MIQETTLQEARRLLNIAAREIPSLTPFGIGVHYAYHRQGREAVALEIQKQQAELGTDRALRMVALCADWINGHRKEFNPHRTSYFFTHVVEQWRRDAGDPDPYIHNGCFIAAAVGLGMNFKVDGPNAVFRLPTLRARVNRALACDGLRLRGNNIVQMFCDGPLPMPYQLGYEPVDTWNVNLEAWAKSLGVL